MIDNVYTCFVCMLSFFCSENAPPPLYVPFWVNKRTETETETETILLDKIIGPGPISSV